jgi:hypothetical protein
MNGKILFGSLLMGSCLALSISTIAYSDDDDWGKGKEGKRYSYYERSPDIAPVTSKAYASECGSCHFAYQPGWLPERSWRKIMSNLDDHFGENAELPGATREKLTNYLVGRSADVLPSRVSPRILRSLRKDETPLRISELAFIRHEHDKFATRMIDNNPKVASRASCQACHTQAAGGFFNEGGVNIPGFGRWED